MAKHVYIKVFVTKKRKLRVDIIPKPGQENLFPYSVTLGGQQWKEGKGHEFRDEILSKAQGIISTLQHQLKEVNER